MADALTSTNARKAALIRWDGEADRYRATQPMRDGFLRKLRDQVLEEHPHLTDEAEIQNRVDRKLKIHRETMRANSLKARRKAADERRQALTDAILSEPGADESESGTDESAA